MAIQTPLEPVRQTTVPSQALLWGWAGVLPFAMAAGAIGFAGTDVAQVAAQILVPYGAIILTFMGGAHWGIATRQSADYAWLYTTGILPSLVAVVAISLPLLPAIAVLAVGLVALLLGDLVLVRRDLLPAWYGRLRTQLTVAVLVCLAVAGFTARPF